MARYSQNRSRGRRRRSGGNRRYSGRKTGGRRSARASSRGRGVHTIRIVTEAAAPQQVVAAPIGKQFAPVVPKRARM